MQPWSLRSGPLGRVSGETEKKILWVERGEETEEEEGERKKARMRSSPG